MIQGLDRTDRAALGLLLLIWEPLMILSIVAFGGFLIWTVSWVRRYGMDLYAWVLLALTIASCIGVITGAGYGGGPHVPTRAS